MKTFVQITTTAALVATLGAMAHASVSDRQLRDAVSEAIAAHPALTAGARVELTHVRPANPTVLSRARSIERVELSRGQKPTGLVTVRVWFDVPSDPGVWVWVRARSKALVPTVVMIRNVERGATLTRGDVEIVHKAPHVQAHSETSMVVGKRTRRQLKSGESVLSGWLEVAPVVKRGDHLEATVQHGGLTVRASAIALGRGSSGEVIKVKIPTTGRVVRGRVISSDRVEVLR